MTCTRFRDEVRKKQNEKRPATSSLPLSLPLAFSWLSWFSSCSIGILAPLSGSAREPSCEKKKKKKKKKGKSGNEDVHTGVDDDKTLIKSCFCHYSAC